MSELINNRSHHIQVRRRLLATASGFVLATCTSLANVASAEDADRPTVWLELGGQMEMMQGLSSPFIAPFMFLTPTPVPYQGVSFIDAQRPPRFAFGEEGKVTFQPAGSDWNVSFGIRYGRSHAKRHTHHQTSGKQAYIYNYPSHDIVYTYAHWLQAEAFLDTNVRSSESHLILNFSVGKDVGIGRFGQDGSSTFNAGVRLVDLTESMTGTVYARPNVDITYQPPKYTIPQPVFNAYALTAQANRSFHGVGPSLSWNASAGIVGDAQGGELMLDWGIDAALLFGKQKAKTQHSTIATHYDHGGYPSHYVGPVYPSRNHHSTRTRSVSIPNVGGFGAISLKWPNAKMSLGYRADFFFGAMDTGVDARETKTLGFNGPFATISIGLGG